MYYNIDVTRWDDTASGIEIKARENAYTVFHALWPICCQDSENIKNMTLWEINPGISVNILESVDF